MVKAKWAINSAFMVFYAFAATMVIWGIWGYQMAFGDQMIPGLVGIPRPILSSHSELKQVRIMHSRQLSNCQLLTLLGIHPVC